MKTDPAPIPLKDLDPSFLPSESAFETKGTNYQKAFRRHRKCAQVLATAGLHREAYLSLVIAAECLFKNIIVMIRHQCIGSGPKSSQIAAILHGETKDSNPGKILGVERYGHKLSALKKTVKDIFPELDKGELAEEFAKFSNNLDDGIDWSKARYIDPDEGNRPWQQSYDDAETSLDEFLKKALPCIYALERNEQ